MDYLNNRVQEPALMLGRNQNHSGALPDGHALRCLTLHCTAMVCVSLCMHGMAPTPDNLIAKAAAKLMTHTTGCITLCGLMEWRIATAPLNTVSRCPKRKRRSCPPATTPLNTVRRCPKWKWLIALSVMQRLHERGIALCVVQWLHGVHRLSVVQWGCRFSEVLWRVAEAAKLCKGSRGWPQPKRCVRNM